MIKSLFDKQNLVKFSLRITNAKDRIKKLTLLKKAIQKHEDSIFVALKNDLRKCQFEAALTEVYFIYGEIDHAIKNLSSWMRPKSARRSLTNILATNKIYYEPKGVCLIIAPWNYPFQLVMSPLISAIAAGNCVIVKPSELSPATADIINKIIDSTFDKEEIACVLGGVDVSTELLALPFDHIFFTGSTKIGKVVMEAASKNLTSCTLELGGKSPVLVTETADIKKAAQKIAWGKLINAGQTCIAPDYLLIHASQKDLFIRHFKEYVHKMFFRGKSINPYVYGKIINLSNFERLEKMLINAIDDGARVDFGGKRELASLSFWPTLISKIPAENKLLSEEIFGPILPIITFENIEEAVQQINSRPKPLAAYLFSNKSSEKAYFLKNTSSGGSCINDVLVHISNPNVPFGGTGPSGMGSSHGKYGFKTFSHERAVVFQSKINLTKMIYPPYAGKEWVLKMMKKLF